MGVYKDMQAMAKFGTNPEVGTAYEDVWAGGGTHIRLAAATLLEVASTSVQDDAGGTGATTILIQGLAPDYTAYQEFLVLDGTTPVATQGEFLFVNRAFVILTNPSGNETNVGIISIADDAATWVAGVPQEPALIQSIILADAGQTQQCIYTIPAGHSLYVSDTYVNGGGNKTVTFQLFSYDNVNVGPGRIALEGTSLNSMAMTEFDPYVQVPEKFTIWFQAKVTAGTGTVSAGINGYLIEDGGKPVGAEQ